MSPPEDSSDEPPENARHRSSWGPAAAVLYDIVTGTMIALLRPMLDLPEDAQLGLWMSAAIVLLASVALGWYLRHLHHQATSTSSPE